MSFYVLAYVVDLSAIDVNVVEIPDKVVLTPDNAVSTSDFVHDVNLYGVYNKVAAIWDVLAVCIYFDCYCFTQGSVIVNTFW